MQQIDYYVYNHVIEKKHLFQSLLKAQHLIPLVWMLLIIPEFLLCDNLSKVTNKVKNEQFLTNTKIMRIENKIDKPYEIGVYLKSITYCTIANENILDFKIEVYKRAEDGSVCIIVLHDKPIMFLKALEKINDYLPIIAQDFNLNRLNLLYFKSPIFYKDLNSELSKSYEKQFGKKRIKYQKLNKFLRNSWLEEKISSFLCQFGKSVERYDIEKFHILKKKYYSNYISNTDFNDYPSFSVHGMGLSVMIY